MDAFRVVRDFEAAIAAYTGAPYVVTTNSCTMAILLACARRFFEQGKRQQFDRGWRAGLPAVTYPSVPMSVIHAGGVPILEPRDWHGAYEIRPWGVWDCALRFTGNMYSQGQMQCVSFHARKLLKIGHGGAILHDNAEADAWLRKARFDGRTEGIPPADDCYDMVGWHCYMLPEEAARGLHLLSYYPAQMPDMPKDPYPDLRRWPIFKS